MHINHLFTSEQQIEKQTIDESITAIESIISKANDIVKGHEERRTNSTELVLDTELLRRNHEVVGKAIEYNTNFTDRMMVAAIVSMIVSLSLFEDNTGSANRKI